MSDETYSKWWITSKRQLEELEVFDNFTVQNTALTPCRDVANHLIGSLYSRYAIVVKNLGGCIDQYCQVQKRSSMKKLLDTAVLRLNQLKQDLTYVNMSEFFYVDGNLIQLHVSPHDVEILDPCVIYDRTVDIEDLWIRVQKGEIIYVPPPPPEQATVATQMPPPEGAPAVTRDGTEEGGQPAPSPSKLEQLRRFNPRFKVLSPEEQAELKRKTELTAAVLLIQTRERARQHNVYSVDIEEQHKLRQRASSRRPPPETPMEVKNKAAISIQRIWKGYSARQQLKYEETKRRLLIGMYEPSWKSPAELKACEENIERRKALRALHLREYVQALTNEKERVLRVIGPGLMEDIGDEIREWFRFWYYSIKMFDKYPPEDQGGSILVVRGETLTPEEFVIEQARLAKEKEMGKDKKAEEKKKAAEEKKKEKEKKKKERERLKKEAEALKKKEEKGEMDYQFGDSLATEDFKSGFKEYRTLWADRSDSDNPGMKHYMDMITDEKCYELQLEIRAKVDELMRIELEMLTEAVELDKWNLKSKGKPMPPKKVKPVKPKKVKKSKDPTANRTTEDLFQQLVNDGIIHTYPKAHLSDFKGDFSFTNWEARNEDNDPPPCVGDVRQLVTLNCILPLGTMNTMPKPKSVLIAGHRKSGKHILANAVFYESQSVLFDLSPPILKGKYKTGKEMKMLIHLITKMSRILQPSIIFIDGAEKTFYKKIPEEEMELQPKKLEKDLFKGIVKPITVNDKVLVLGITNQPFAAKPAGLKKAYEKSILIPRTDYGTLYLYWRELLMPYHGVDRNFSVSELAKYSLTYPLASIKEIFDTVMIPERIITLKDKPLNAHEFIEIFLDAPEPVVDKEWKKFDGWYSKLPLQKKRAHFVGIAQTRKEALAKLAAKKKAGG